jgi:hypothetical protein
MSWWRKLFGQSTADRASKQASPPGERISPVRIEIMAGELSVQVYVHEIVSQQGIIPCWSYVTEGMAAHGQTEIVFTLRREVGELSGQFPEEPLHLFATIHGFAKKDRRVTAGGATEFGARSFFGHHLLYVKAQPLDGVTLPGSCLTALLVTADELRAVRAFGCARVLARMGQASRYYPFPPWTDRRRRGLPFDSTFEASLLSRTLCLRADDVRVGKRGNQIIVDALRSEQASWLARLAQVPDTAPLALLTTFDPSANACLTWVPGQNGPAAITPPGSDGSRPCGCFIAFVAEQSTNGGRLFEDGFAMLLTSDAWRAMRRALVEGKELSIPASGDEMSLALTWRDEVYVSPIDGQSYTALGGWNTYQPNTPATAETNGRVKVGDLRLLTSEAEIAARTTVDDMVAFLREIERSAQRVLGAQDDQGEIVMRLQCKPQGHDVTLSGRGGTPQQLVEAMFEAVKQLPAMTVSDGEVAFEVAVKVSAAGPAVLPS